MSDAPENSRQQVMIRRLALLTAAFAASCSPKPPMIFSVSGESSDVCTFTHNSHVVLAKDIPALTQQWDGKSAVIAAAGNTPYRCIGAIVFNLQRSGVRKVIVTVDGKPLPKAP
ncbi:GerMN domain-containing protein [Rhizorhabdus wittichii]|uniref:GerMN domain-containing protein n=1 Tax=Rhizorhabdus wittichii TaxID=160791 RepID=UPI0012694CD7|nr:GerMN domain-containing protein [Rhizorhabdus wittichii]